jgi:hypothetical protein
LYFNDVIIGFTVALIILMIAWMLMPFFTNSAIRKYFIPALVVKMASAIFLGLLYHFYYRGGDTFTYFTNGGIHIYNAFWDKPILAWHLIFGETDYTDGVFKYASQIWMYNDPSSYVVVRITGFISLFVGGSYIATSLIFAALSFSGIWAMYVAFTKLFPGREWLLALAILFIPSAVFWGSGILKDTITFGFLGWASAAFIHLMYRKQKNITWILIFIFSLFVIYQIKLYVVMSLLPAMIVWAYFVNIGKVENPVLRYMIAPFIIAITIVLAGLAVYTVGENNRKYAVENLAKTAQITAYDVGRYTGRNAGSGYDLGDLDGTFLGMLKLGPAAINVAMFRPYLWEVKNPLMLLASLEGLILLILTIIVLVKSRSNLLSVLNNPAIIFSLIFSLTFAFAVGISTYNFGTLFRYKVPLMPFYGIFLAIAWKGSGKTKKDNQVDFKI